MTVSRTMFSGRIRPFSEEFAESLRTLADAAARFSDLEDLIVAKVMEPTRFVVAGAGSGADLTWALINATQTGGTITTGVAPTDVGDGVFEYKAVPVKITGYAAGAFTYAVSDDDRFSPDAYGGGTHVTLLNAPTHENDADRKYAGVNTGAGSDYPAGFDVRGIGELRDPGGGASTWWSPPVLIQKYQVDDETTLWLLMAEPDHDGACAEGGGGGGASEASILAIGAMRA